MFKFLPMAEFEGLAYREKLIYLRDAMDELDRTNMPPDDPRWHSLFTEPLPQQRRHPD